MQKYDKLEDLKLKKAREDLQNRLDFLKKQAEVRQNFVIKYQYSLSYQVQHFHKFSHCINVRAMMTEDLLLILLFGMMVTFGGLLLTHKVLRIVLILENWLILFL